MPQLTSFVESNFDVNALVTITIPAQAGRTHRIEKLEAFFSGPPSGSEEVVVTINAVEYFRAPIDSQATGGIWPVDLSGAANENVVVTLDAGGPLNTGRLVVRGRTTS